MLCNNAHNRDGTLKTKLENFHNIFLNSDFSLNICSIFAKFLENVFYSLPEGSVSQILIYVLVIFLCYVEIEENYFFTIIYVLHHKNVTRT